MFYDHLLVLFWRHVCFFVFVVGQLFFQNFYLPHGGKVFIFFGFVFFPEVEFGLGKGLVGDVDYSESAFRVAKFHVQGHVCSACGRKDVRDTARLKIKKLPNFRIKCF